MGQLRIEQDVLQAVPFVEAAHDDQPVGDRTFPAN